mmetsp:Transcript_12352/g.37103  ORF Transcript_12352/g.37103 Transcript_12352/m.37103 type:complete len:104 (-) Transcript_12352:403-714(-)
METKAYDTAITEMVQVFDQIVATSRQLLDHATQITHQQVPQDKAGVATAALASNGYNHGGGALRGHQFDDDVGLDSRRRQHSDDTGDTHYAHEEDVAEFLGEA